MTQEECDKRVADVWRQWKEYTRRERSSACLEEFYLMCKAEEERLRAQVGSP